MLKDKTSFNNKKRVIAIIAVTAATILSVVSISAIVGARLSYQQASDRQGPRITSANIVDEEVKNQDLAANSVTSDKIQNGQVKEEDLDPSIQIGGATPNFQLQVTERSKSAQFLPEGSDRAVTLSVQCNSDEVVTGGGLSWNGNDEPQAIKETKKQDNGWTVTWGPLFHHTSL